MAPKDMKFETYRKSTDLIKSRFEKLEESVTRITSSDPPLTPVQVRQLNTIFAELQKKRADFEVNLQRIIESENEDATETILSKDVDEINDFYVRISSVIEVSLAVDPTTPPSEESRTVAPALPPATLPSVKLPKLNLQTFDGDHLKWISFINLFDTTVHTNAAISNVTKLQYLLSVLSGEPLNLIKSFNLTAANYMIAYNLLKQRYHNTRRLTTLHLNHLMDLPAISHKNPKQMRALITSFYEHTESLKALDCDVTQNNPFFAAHLLRKLDNKTVQQLEQYRENKNESHESHSLPQVTEIIKFLNLECSHIEDASLHTLSADVKSPHSHKAPMPKRPHHRSNVAMVTQTSNAVVNPQTPLAKAKNSAVQCFQCNSTTHKIYSCDIFKNQTPHERYQIVKQHKRCISCLGSHDIKDCHSKSTCRTCNKRHHTMLHFNSTQGNSNANYSARPQGDNVRQTAAELPANETSSQFPVTLTSQGHQNSSLKHTTVLLGTLLVKLTSTQGTTHVFRALLDSGSMCDLITEHAAQLLGTRRYKSEIKLTGLSNHATQNQGQTYLNIETLSGQLIATQHPMLILDNLTANLPRVPLSPDVFARTKQYMLADPSFHLPGRIDVVLGGALYPQLLTNKHYSLGQNMPHVVGTRFGYVVMGTAPCTPPTTALMQPTLMSNHCVLHALSDADLHSSLQRFWTQEELPPSSKKSAEEIKCDELFAMTHTRDQDGRYTVRLPFAQDPAKLGSSKKLAEQRFQSLERKLNLPTSDEFHKLYTDFMSEYHSLGHMDQLPHPAMDKPHYFLPHHGVLKAQSSTTKLRVVFDASAKTSSGLSLNDVLITGPKLQNNICDILLHFRLKNVVFSCDIRQMYRQIKVHPDDQKFQLILWRDAPALPLSVYQLTTVTYGLNCSPYLAIKTLRQLAQDEGSRFPQAAEILKNHSYVDDLIAGASTEEEALELQNQLINLLHLGGFELRKWVSNSPKLLQQLPSSHQETPVFLQPSADPHFSILGIYWSPTTDCFKYSLNFTCDNPTKRKVLSVIAKIYDPCGFLSPCIMTAKRFMQLLWTSGISWDAPLTPELSQQWQSFVSDLKNVVEISIPRALTLPHLTQCDIHGFADASETGYAAVVYLRSVSDTETRVTQVLAKTRAAPLKRVTLPRLELCAAHLLAQLVHHVVSQYSDMLEINSLTLWSDSTVTLSWVQTPPYRLKTYVANRVAQIQELIPVHSWRHVLSADNPADCASRGVLPSQLVNHPLWWHGPAWLQFPTSSWPTSDFSPIDVSALDEVKSTPLTVFIAAPPLQGPIDYLLNRFSSWTKLLHVMAYVLRFVTHSRRRGRHDGSLSVAELQGAQFRIFKLIQRDAFADDILALENGKLCSSRLQRLASFIDKDGLLRVGGRLHHSDLSDDVRHPCILPKKHHVIDLLIEHTHVHHLHSGVQLTLSLLSQQVWILSARSVVRSCIFKCMVCFRQKPRNTFPLMGDLPKSRVTPARPFVSVGIDYGGPFTIKVHNLRSIRHIKAYICIFVCFAIKAVHIEVATDLSTDSFIAALTRFVSRRGLCTDIYSDCATNFVGARNALHELIHSSESDKINEFALNRNIRFHFNPPAAPHQGGLWESAIKSAKYHLKRVLGTHIPTLIQFNTLTCQIEAMLNSRPLTAMSSDPNDLQTFTPGHFLIGCPLAALPEPAVAPLPDNRLSQWQLIHAFMQRIWKRWTVEYLHTLQQRLKWTKPTKNLEVGDLVLIHQDTPSLVWPLARITKVTTGHDDIVRVVELKTQNGILTRPAVKVFLLPFLTQKD